MSSTETPILNEDWIELQCVNCYYICKHIIMFCLEIQKWSIQVNKVVYITKSILKLTELSPSVNVTYEVNIISCNSSYIFNKPYLFQQQRIFLINLILIFYSLSVHLAVQLKCKYLLSRHILLWDYCRTNNSISQTTFHIKFQENCCQCANFCHFFHIVYFYDFNYSPFRF